MRILKIFVVAFLPLLIFLAGCQLEEPSALKTQTDLKGKTVTSYVAMGNSLTAGVQSGSMVEDFQQYSFPNLIAKQLGITDFAQPTVSYPGIPNVLELNPATLSIAEAPGAQGTPTNLNYAAPYNNLGIPTAMTWDILHTTTTNDNYRYKFYLEENDAVDLVLRGQGTMFQQAAAQHPGLITLWIGNNDVLGFATSGGLKPITPFDVGGIFPSPVTGELIPDFKAACTELMDTVATLGAMVAVSNVPDVTSVPFFTTVGPGIAQSFVAGGIPYPLSFEKYGDDLSTGIASGQATTDDLADGTVLVTLVGAGYTGEIGKPSGLWYRDLAAMKGVPVSALLATMPVVDTTQAFGLHPQNPWPSALILDADEIAMAQAATVAYNQLIGSLAAAHGFAYFDANAFMANIVSTGYYMTQGMTFTPTLVSGGMFSLDGVHLSSAGYAVIANMFIEAINSTYSVDIAPVTLSSVIGHAPIKKVAAASLKYNLSGLSSVMEMLGGKIW